MSVYKVVIGVPRWGLKLIDSSTSIGTVVLCCTYIRGYHTLTRDTVLPYNLGCLWSVWPLHSFFPSFLSNGREMIGQHYRRNELNQTRFS